MGRLFDAVASIISLRDFNRYEAQAAIELESLASRFAADGAYPFELADSADGLPIAIDVRPMIRAIAADVARGTGAGQIARRFHSTLVDVVAATCQRLCEATGIEAVALSGGVFMNALLTAETVARLSADGLRVYRHRLVPPNDGGICLGQLAIAAARLGQTGGDAKHSQTIPTRPSADRKRNSECASAYPVG